MSSSTILHRDSDTSGASLSFDASAQGCATVFEVSQGKGLSDAFSAASVAVRTNRNQRNNVRFYVLTRHDQKEFVGPTVYKQSSLLHTGYTVLRRGVMK